MAIDSNGEYINYVPFRQTPKNARNFAFLAPLNSLRGNQTRPSIVGHTFRKKFPFSGRAVPRGGTGTVADGGTFVLGSVCVCIRRRYTCQKLS